MAADKILWTDKSDNVVSALPATEKITAANTQEIKDVVNSHADDIDSINTTVASNALKSGLVPFTWKFDDGGLSGDPGAGNFRMNNILNSASSIDFSTTDNEGRDVSEVLDLLIANSYIYIQKRSESGLSGLFKVTSLTDNGSYYSLTLLVRSGGGSLTDKDICAFGFLPYVVGGSGGEVNTSSNSGSGFGLALAKVGADLPFKSLTTDTGLAYVSSATELKINVREQYISGARETDASVSGAKSLDWEVYKVFEYTLTGNTTLSDLNLPTGTDTKVIELIIDGNYTLTLPAYWEALPDNDTYDGTRRNHLVVSCINGTTSSEDVLYSLQNLT